MKRLLCSVLCLMLLYVPFASAAIDATQTNELLADAYQQGLMAYGVLMRADLDTERQQLDVTLTENRFTLAQMEAKDLRDVLAASVPGRMGRSSKNFVTSGARTWISSSTWRT